MTDPRALYHATIVKHDRAPLQVWTGCPHGAAPRRAPWAFADRATTCDEQVVSEPTNNLI